MLKKIIIGMVLANSVAFGYEDILKDSRVSIVSKNYNHIYITSYYNEYGPQETKVDYDKEGFSAFYKTMRIKEDIETVVAMVEKEVGKENILNETKDLYKDRVAKRKKEEKEGNLVDEKRVNIYFKDNSSCMIDATIKGRTHVWFYSNEGHETNEYVSGNSVEKELDLILGNFGESSIKAIKKKNLGKKLKH